MFRHNDIDPNQSPLVTEVALGRLPVVAELHDDAPAFWLREYDQTVKGFRWRFQIVEVLTPRGTRKAYEDCIGLASEFQYQASGAIVPCPPFEIIAGVQDNRGKIYSEITVARLREMADQARYRGPSDETVEYQLTAPDDMENTLYIADEEAIKDLVKESVFGPYYRNERR